MNINDVRAELTRHKVTQQRLASEAGVSQSTVNRALRNGTDNLDIRCAFFVLTGKEWPAKLEEVA